MYALNPELDPFPQQTRPSSHIRQYWSGARHFHMIVIVDTDGNTAKTQAKGHC